MPKANKRFEIVTHPIRRSVALQFQNLKKYNHESSLLPCPLKNLRRYEPLKTSCAMVISLSSKVIITG